MAKQLDRTLGFWSVYTISMGAMMGSGIFVLPGIAASVAGPWVCLSYMLAGLMVLPAVFTKCELATSMPVAGGTYVYVDRAMGAWMGTITGIGTWIALCSKTAFALAGLGSYLVFFSDVHPMVFALAVLTGLVALNMIGVGKVTNIQKFIVFTCIAALLVFSTLGAQSYSSELMSPAFPEGAAGIISGAAFVFVSYAGVTKICSIAEEVHHPERNLPLGMFASQFTVMTLYVIVSWVITSNVLYSAMDHDKTPVATAAGVFLGFHGQKFMAAIAVLGLISMCNAGVLSSSRFPFAMSRDSLLPSAFHHISERFGTPTKAIFATGVFLVALITFLPVKELAKLASGFKIFLFCINHLALIVLRESNASWYKPRFRSPFYPWTQLVGVLGGLWLLSYLGGLPIIGIAAGILVGTAWYFWYVRKRVDRSSALRHLWGETRLLRETEMAELAEELTDQAPRVIVPFFGQEESTRHLVRLGAAFVDVGILEVVRLEEVPQQIPLLEAAEEDSTMLRISRESEQVAHELHVQLDFHDVVTHHAKDALLHHAEATLAQWIIMDWPSTRKESRLIRFPMSWWESNTPCDLAIFKDRGADRFRRILVLAEPGPYDSLVVHVADRLARQEKGELVLFRIVGEDTTPEQMQAERDYHHQLRQLTRSETKSLILKTDDPKALLAEVSKKFDVLILGAPHERPLFHLFFGSREHRYAEAAKCSVLLLKTPRHRVHPRLELPQERGEAHFDLGPYLSGSAIGVRVRGGRKEDVFRAMSERLAEVVQVGSTSSIEAALWERERRQSTALTGGVALLSATCASINTTVLGVFTLEQPVDFRGGGGEPVDVCLVTVAPPAERQTQLWMLARLARMTLRPGFLSAMRKSTNVRDLRDAIRLADESIDRI